MADTNQAQSIPSLATGSARARFGAFGGVFTPSILTILGVVMYMRFGWVVGQQGLLGSLAIVAVAHLAFITRIDYAPGAQLPILFRTFHIVSVPSQSDYPATQAATSF